MHDPMVLVFDLPPYELRKRFRHWPHHLTIDVWHDEPGGRDSGTVCKGMGSSELTWHNLRWAWRHRSHLHYRVWPYLSVKRWIVDRCDHCGRRFLWRDARIGECGGGKVWHEQCSSLRHVQSQLDDLTRYVQGTADSTTRWRVEYRLKHLDERAEAST